MAKDSVQELDPKLAAHLASALKKTKADLKCPECGGSLGSWTLSGLGSGKSFSCKKCKTTVQADTSDIRDILTAIERL